MYVANFGGGAGTTVSVIDTNTFALIDTDGNAGNGITPITVNSGPINIAVDEEVGSNKIYVTHYTSAFVSIIDTITFAVTPVDLPAGSTNSWGVEYHPIDGTANDDTMYVTNFNQGNVFVYASDTGTLIDTITQAELTGNGPTDITYDPDLKRMYVTNFNSNSVSVIDTTTNTVIDTDGNAGNGITPITVGSQPVFVAYDPICEDMYVTNQGGTTVSVIDTTTNQVIDTITVGSTPIGIAYDIVHDRMYVANAVSNTVSVINLCGCAPFDEGTDSNGSLGSIIPAQASLLQENSLTTNAKPEAEIHTFSEKMSPPSVPATGDSSAALEKIDKLKKQWLDLLP
jgi:YVTN family beta-propeller protein